jgi:hypothetical protein
MTLESGVGVAVRYKTYASGAIADVGTPASPGASGGQVLRRVASTMNLQRETYQSTEIRSDRQVADYRLGTKRVQGDISGELSPGTYWDFMVGMCRGTAASEISKTQTEFTSVAATNSTSKFTVAASTWLSEGFKVGDVIRFSTLSVAANNDVNYLITALSTVDATVTPAPTDMSADTTFTVLRKGKKVFIPSSSHTDTLFAIEHYHQDVDLSQLFKECRVGRMQLGLPATGLATSSFGFMGRDMEALATGSSPYLTAPTASTTTGLVAAVNGLLRFGGSNNALITGANINFDLQPSAEAVVGSLFVPEIFLGDAQISGDLSFLLQDFTQLSNYTSETALELHLLLETGGSAPHDFIKISLPNIVLTKHDIGVQGRAGVPVQAGFMARLKATATGYDSTTITIQDSAAA